FWFVDLDGEGFREHEVTDITLYDTDDQSALVWFTVPKATGSPVWLQPYFTDNLDEYVLSYNVPVYKFGRFIGVIGIEIDYDTIVEPVSAITLYDNGYAFINNDEGDIIYHPRMALEDLTGENKPKVPDGLLSENSNVRYTFEGVEKQAVWMPLNNGMRLNVTVPISEINQRWHTLIREIVGVSVALLVLFIFLTMRLSNHITKPLRELTEVAEQVDAGNYDVDLRYNGDDEVGILTRTFSTVIGHLKTYISDLNSLAYADALTSVRNKGAFDLHVREMDARIKDPDDSPEFAVGFFDCDDLKSINDEFGHDKGDIYLQIASDLICRVFRHSPVFRTGGDEFAVILQGEDYRNRSDLALFFNEVCMGNADTHNAKWEKVGVSLGIAAYDPKTDYNFNDVARRADKLMYENKRARKATRGGVPEQA
ncbi:MAG: diguanylate cyclase, partial [Firmicutes bacterium]|nr:diguanylate cyclase [Bacillota bacterium]